RSNAASSVTSPETSTDASKTHPSHLTRHRSVPKITDKRGRMPYIAGIGLFLLTPAAFTLDRLALRGEFGAVYLLVQTVEVLAAATALALMAGNIRDGLRLTGRH
ncbi:hypothetical protein AB0H57_20120, partial [Micromonospora sp. NPDC050686]|uniref:hypothetical protein n=1 Tax=Micromonospora sp. NPDC050686 TaxID=3154631 RepID=UPI0033E779CD